MSREDDPKEGMKRKVRNVIERMLRFYMRGIGKVQEGRDPSLNQPAAPGDYQFNYIPDGLREDEVASRYVLLNNKDMIIIAPDTAQLIIKPDPTLILSCF